MDKNTILNAIKKVREISKKRNFQQTFDLVISLKNFQIKKNESRIDNFITLPHGRGKKLRICALVDQVMAKKATDFDKVIVKEQFNEYKNKNEMRKLASEYDFFVAQANLMGPIATTFGRVFGPRGKMPNPKAGCVVPPEIELKPVYEKLQRTVRMTTKGEPSIKVPVGTETMKDEAIVENILAIYNNLLSLLPEEKNNINKVIIKLTMSQGVII